MTIHKRLTRIDNKSRKQNTMHKKARREKRKFKSRQKQKEKQDRLEKYKNEGLGEFEAIFKLGEEE